MVNAPAWKFLFPLFESRIRKGLAGPPGGRRFKSCPQRFLSKIRIQSMSELIDVVDENDHIIGKATREKIHNSEMWHRGIHIFNSKKELPSKIEKLE